LRTDNGSNAEWYHELGWITGGAYLDRGNTYVASPPTPGVMCDIPEGYMNGTDTPTRGQKQNMLMITVGQITIAHKIEKIMLFGTLMVGLDKVLAGLQTLILT
jgi:hypothetical protein